MKIHKITTTSLEENSYILEENNSAILIDAGSDYEKIINTLKKNQLELKLILITHNHEDHTISINEIKKHTNAKIMMSEKDINLQYGTEFIPDLDLTNNKIIEFEQHKILAISTPGHTKGSFCFYIEKENIIFTGDTLFKQAIGRTDLPTGSEKEMQNSLKKLLSLPENTIVFPGHGEKTTIKEEKTSWL